MKIKLLFLLSIIFIILSCSSKPKLTGEVDAMRKQAEAGLEMGNKAAIQENFRDALLLINEAKRKAVMVDDPSLIIRTSLSLGNVYLSMGDTDDAFSEWDSAIAEAQRIENQELLSVSRIFRARGSLLTNRDTPLNIFNIVNREQVNIKSNRYYIAFSDTVRGLTLRALGSYAEAEAALLRSIAIYEKDLYLENASFDWYVIASVRSLAGNYTGAINALQTSMALDRRIENSRGLAASWSAMGDVYNKMGREQEAEAAHARSKAIIEALER